jgi:hypothetical protein
MHQIGIGMQSMLQVGLKAFLSRQCIHQKIRIHILVNMGGPVQARHVMRGLRPSIGQGRIVFVMSKLVRMTQRFTRRTTLQKKSEIKIKKMVFYLQFGGERMVGRDEFFEEGHIGADCGIFLFGASSQSVKFDISERIQCIGVDVNHRRKAQID